MIVRDSLGEKVPIRESVAIITFDDAYGECCQAPEQSFMFCGVIASEGREKRAVVSPMILVRLRSC
jgi:hypothetical protein